MEMLKLDRVRSRTMREGGRWSMGRESERPRERIRRDEGRWSRERSAWLRTRRVNWRRDGGRESRGCENIPRSSKLVIEAGRREIGSLYL
jgi:hypothetical protein